MLSAETQARFASWRMKAAAGELSQDDMKEIILALRAGRNASAASASTSRKKAAMREIPRAEDLLGELDELG